jgi:plasmid replication initiation protein
MAKKPNIPKMANSKTPKVYKNKKLNNANFADFGLNDYQVFLYLISKIGKVDTDGKYLQPETLQREHTITALDFAKAFNIELPNAYPILQKSAVRLIKSFLTVEQMDLFETWQVGICSVTKYNHKEGSLSVTFTEHIMPYLAQVKQKFVLYNLKEIANFNSLYTTRFYELIQEWQSTGYIIKSVDQLREFFAVGNTLSLYTNFKAKTFQHAINEINAKTSFNVRFTEIKTGRKVTAIEFHFVKTVVEKRFKADGTQQNTYIKPLEKKEPKPKRDLKKEFADLKKQQKLDF